MAGLSKLEYLKKYMSGDDERKKIKPKSKIKKQGVRLIDDDVTFANLPPTKSSKTSNKLSDDEVDNDEDLPLLYLNDGSTAITDDFLRRKHELASKWAPLSGEHKDADKHEALLSTKELLKVASSEKATRLPITMTLLGSKSSEKNPIFPAAASLGEGSRRISRQEDRIGESGRKQASESLLGDLRCVVHSLSPATLGLVRPSRSPGHEPGSGQSYSGDTSHSSSKPSDGRSNLCTSADRPILPDVSTYSRDPDKNRSRTRHDSPDLSPRRQGVPSQLYDIGSSELSLNRKASHPDRVASPSRSPSSSCRQQVRPKARHDSPDLSPKRSKATGPRYRTGSPDLSPPRKTSRTHGGTNIASDLSPERPRQTHRPANKDERLVVEPEVMSSGKRAGLVTAEELHQANEIARKSQKELLRSLDPSVSGLGAETIYRDESGAKVDARFERLRKRAEDERKSQIVEQLAEWGKGLTQKKDRQDKAADDLHEMNKPLARYIDDADLDSKLRQRERHDDPMLTFVKKDKRSSVQSGLPMYRGPPGPPNRFNIRPGYRWDGVNRSNGFEQKFFAMVARKKALAREYHTWSVEDM